MRRRRSRTTSLDGVAWSETSSDRVAKHARRSSSGEMVIPLNLHEQKLQENKDALRYESAVLLAQQLERQHEQEECDDVESIFLRDLSPEQRGAVFERVCEMSRNLPMHEHGGGILDVSVSADAGMKGTSFVSARHGLADVLVGVREAVMQQQLDREASEALLNRELQAADMECDRIKSLYFGLDVTEGLVKSERNTDIWQKREQQWAVEFMQNCSDEERTTLLASGGLGGNFSFTDVPITRLRDTILRFAREWPLRHRHYGRSEFMERRRSNRLALDRVAERLRQWMADVAQAQLQVANGELRGRELEQRMVELRSLPAGKRKRTRRGRKKKKKQRRDGASARKRARLDEHPRYESVRVTVRFGNWAGNQPKFYKGRGRTNSFPRKGLERAFLNGVRQIGARQMDAGVCVVFQPETADEYRSSKQAPELIHWVRGERVDRQQAQVTDCKGRKRRVWKVLECPACGVRLHRDMSAAFAMDLKHRWSIVARAKHAAGEKQVELEPAGYSR